jgi:hypothetical protein
VAGTFPFVWEKYFVSEIDSSDCVPACVAMTARYWIHKKAISLPPDLTDWRAYFEKLKIHTHRGTSISLLENALKKITPKGKVGLRCKVYHVQKVADLTKLFDLEIPIPVILRYDRSRVLRNVTGTHHAALLHSLDIVKERVRVIDPSLPDRDTPSTYDMADFLRGWDETGKEIIITYPTNIRVPINMRKIIQHTPIDEFVTSR